MVLKEGIALNNDLCKMGDNLTLVMAYDLNGLVGRNNDLPWRISEDLDNFKKTTVNQNKKNIIVMGFNTLLSFNGRLLPDRISVVITKDIQKVRDLGYIVEDDAVFIDNSFNGVLVFSSIEEFLNKPNKDKRDVFIIGGVMLSNYCFEKDLVKGAIITEIEMDCGVLEGDVIFNKSLLCTSLFKKELIDEIQTSGGVTIRVFKYGVF